MNRDIAGKIVVITGASRGIGVAIAKRLASYGPHLVLAARSQDALQEVAEVCRAHGASTTVVACDVSVAAEREALVQAAENVGPIDILVNNAGVEVPISVLDHAPEDIDRTLQVNLVAPIQLSRTVLPAMVARKTGVIVNVSSMSGKSPTPYNSIYTATKFGLNGFTASLRIELEGTGVHCGVICPSFVEGSGMWAELGLSAPRMVQEVPMARVVDAVERVVDGAPEVLITTPLARPMLALAQFFPRLDQVLLDRLGVMRTLRARAIETKRRRGEG